MQKIVTTRKVSVYRDIIEIVYPESYTYVQREM